MKNALLVDTNVLVYAIDEDSRFHESATRILSDPTKDLFTTSKNISEFLVVLTRDPMCDLNTSDCLDLLDGLVGDFQILFPNHGSLGIFRRLVEKYEPRGLRIHDIEIASIAIAHGISVVATANVSDFGRISELDIEKISQ